MAIQMRRGADRDFDKSRMLPGELAVTTDGSRKVYAAFAAGDVKELASEEKMTEFQAQLDRKAQEIQSSVTSVQNTAQAALQKASQVENDTSDDQYQIDELKKSADAAKLLLNEKVDGAYVENGYLYLTSNNEIVAGPLGPFSGTGGGGGSGGNNAELSVSNATGWLSRTIAEGDSCELKLNWSSTEDNVETGNGTMKITVNGIAKALLDIAQGSVTAEVSKYLAAGANVVKVNIEDVYGNSRTISYSITSVAISVSSSFDASIPYQGIISFPVTPVGAVQKTVHLLVDGQEVGNMSTPVSGRQLSFTIPQQTHGNHVIRCYFDCEINGQTVRSNELYYEVICLENGQEETIIASSFREENVKQFTTMNIKYQVYKPGSLTADVKIYANDVLVTSQTVDREVQTFTYRADEVGSLSIRIVSGSKEKTFEIQVSESDIHVEAETDQLKLYLSSSGRSNNEENPGVWQYGDIHAELTGFNFSSDGWLNDAEGITMLRVSGDARVEIPYQPFASDCRTTGKTIELEFSTSDVMDYDAEIISCMSGDRGFSLTAQKAVMKSEQSEIFMQYKENEHLRVTFVAEKRSEYRLIYCYINGIMSGVVRYPEQDDFSQAVPVNISVGSNKCTTDLYCIRIYDNDLTRHQLLENWIADTQNVEKMLDRYRRNQVFDDYGNVVIARLPEDLPYLIFEAAELPQYKGDKKTVKCTYVDPLAPANSFTCVFQLDVQGTSSQYYYRKNYKGKCKDGFTLNNGTVSPTYKLRSDAIGTNTFTFKADVASSEGCNNVELVRFYNDACPYRTPAQEADPAVRQGIDGFPIVIFWNNGTETTFLGKYNFNNDKGTPEVYGFTDEDESWEVLNNTSDRVLWKSDDFSDDSWQNDFEARHPDGNMDVTQLAEFSSWLKSTDRTAATGNTLSAPVAYDGTEYTADTAEYRLAKFKAEAGRYMELDSAMFYYLMTELFLLVDSRAKNMFPSMIGGTAE